MAEPKPPSDAELMAMALAAAERAYAPYSRFYVGAVAVTGEGDVVSGANVENAAYGSTLCAEAVAIGAAIAAGARSIQTVAVACLSGDACYPCGQCRQRMREFGVEHVVVRDGAGGTRSHALEELLPNAFGPEDLDGA